MQKIIRLLPVVILLALFYSCSYENLEEYYGEISCDTVNVSFSETVFPIIERNCLGCHYDGNSIGIELTSYNKIKAKIDEGKVLGNIKHEPGFRAMPPNAMLDDCSISKIENWINDGIQNN
jgi:hypothetical protein